MKPSMAVRGKMLVVAAVGVLLLPGCGKQGAGAKLPPEITAKLAEIKQAGEPVTLMELDAFYAKVPDGENAAPLYARAFDAIATEDLKSPGMIDKNRQALELLRQAAMKPRCRYPVDLKQGYAASMPHIPKIKFCAQLIMTDALRQMSAGRTEVATEDLRTCLAMARTLESDPTLIGQLTRCRAEVFATAGLQEMASLKPFTDAQLKQMASAFAEAETGAAGTFTRALVGERCSFASLFLEPAKYASESLGSAGKNMTPSEVEAYRNSDKGPADFGFGLDRMNSSIALAKKQAPDYLEGIDPWMAEARESKTKGLVIAQALVPSLERVLSTDARNLSELRLSQTILAVEQYRLEHNGTLPPSLNALMPQFLSAVPLDAFDGKPIRFKKRLPKGYIVYSVGTARQDNGGVEQKPGTAKDTKSALVLTVGR